MKKITFPTKRLFYLLSFLFISISGFSQVLEVKGNGNVIPNGDTTPNANDFTNFGSVPVNGKFGRTFIIKNTGTSSLTFPATTVTLSGTNADQFKITTNVIINPKFLSAGTYTTIEVSFEPTTTTTPTKTATLTIDPSNGSPSTYSFTIQGTAIAAIASPDFVMSKLTVNNTFNYPYVILYGPDNYLWLTERVGKKINRVDPATGAVDLLIDLGSAVYQTGGQDGLMSMVLDPNFATNKYVYVAYTYSSTGSTTDDTTRRTKIVRYTYSVTSNNGSLASPTTIIQGLAGSNDHNSGKLRIGPDNKLYYTIGDNGANQFGNWCKEVQSQTLPSQADVDAANYLNSYQGKILRMNLDGTVPADNPTISGVKSHIYTYGHRNPQGLVFGKNGKLYSSEHGPKSDDEINIIRSGENYGWPYIAGYKDNKNYAYCNWSTSTLTPRCQSSLFTDYACGTGATSTTEMSWNGSSVDPIGTFFTIDDGYNFTGGYLSWPTIAPSSAAVYESFNSQIPGWDNSLLITTLKKGELYRQKLSADGNSTSGEPEAILYTQNRYRDVAMDPDGKTFYIITDSGGATSGPSGSQSLSVVDPGVILKFVYQPSLVSCVAPTPVVATLPTITGQCSVTSITAPTATNTCAGTIVGQTDTVFPITSQGTTTVVWTYKYGNGNTLTQNQTVTIDDTTAPATPTLADATGQCSVTPTTPTTTDACAGTITGTTATTFPITTQGTTVVVWNFNDGNGQSINVNQNVIVDDTIAPATPTLADVSGDCSVTIIAPTTTDACAGTITGTTTDPTTYYTQGTHTIHWTFDDGNGQIINVNQNAIVNTAATTSITDVNFEQALIDLGFDCYIDGKVITSSINTIISLDISNYNISTLTGLEDFSSLETLYCGNNSLTTLNVSALANLNYLDFQNNAVNNLNITGLTTLQVLVALNNNLSTLDVSNNPNLNYLDADNNNLTSLIVSGTSLTDLYCIDNELTTLDLSGLSSLDYFTGENNSMLSCIIVDDVTIATANVNWSKDGTADYVAATPTITLADITAECTVTATAPSISIRCSNNVVGTTSDPITYSEQGSYVIHWNFDDNNGNTASANQNVIVEDVTAPVPNITTLPTITELYAATITPPTATDICSGTINGTTTDPLTYNEEGTYVITWTFDDGNNNTITQEQTVEITDTFVPLTKVRDDLCGVTFTILNKTIYADIVPDAQMYKFEVTNGETVRVVETTLSNFKITDLVGGAFYNTSYVIRIASKTNDIWSEYGTPCNVNTPIVPMLTKVKLSQCESTLASLNTNIYSIEVFGVQKYRFEVTNGENIRTYESTSSNFKLTDLINSTLYNTSYTIRIATKANDIWGNYGEACIITTPSIQPITKIKTSQCGIILATLKTNIYADEIPQVQGYRFEVTEGSNIRTYDSSSSSFNLSLLIGGANYNTNYSIKVATKINDIWGQYGLPCNISTPVISPLTKIKTAQCGITLSNFKTNIYSNAVQGVQGYRFEVTNGLTTRIYDSPNYYFNLTQLEGVNEYNTNYYIRVATKVGQIFGAYGEACYINTPSLITARLENSENTLALDEVKKDNTFLLYPVPFNDQITIDFPNSHNGNLIQIQLYDLNGRLIFDTNQNVFDKKIQLNGLSKLSEGNYLLFILDQNQKILLNRNIIKRVSE